MAVLTVPRSSRAQNTSGDESRNPPVHGAVTISLATIFRVPVGKTARNPARRPARGTVDTGSVFTGEFDVSS